MAQQQNDLPGLPPSYNDIGSQPGVEEASPQNQQQQPGPEFNPILTKLQNITTTLQKLLAGQAALDARLASFEERLTANEGRSLNARIRERNAASTRTDEYGPLEPLYDIQSGGLIPDCPPHPAAILNLSRSECARILAALEVDIEDSPPMSFVREAVRQEFIMMDNDGRHPHHR